jgi:hypothetical protein
MVLVIKKETIKNEATGITISSYVLQLSVKTKKTKHANLFNK